VIYYLHGNFTGKIANCTREKENNSELQRTRERGGLDGRWSSESNLTMDTEYYKIYGVFTSPFKDREERKCLHSKPSALEEDASARRILDFLKNIDLRPKS